MRIGDGVNDRGEPALPSPDKPDHFMRTVLIIEHRPTGFMFPRVTAEDNATSPRELPLVPFSLPDASEGF